MFHIDSILSLSFLGTLLFRWRKYLFILAARKDAQSDF